MLNPSQILEGWRNNLFPPEKLKELIDSTQKERLAKCLNCPFNSTNGKIKTFSYCKSCGCPLKAKTACLSCACPEHYWEATASKEDNELIHKTITNEPVNTRND